MKKSAILLGSRRQQSPKTEGQGNIQEIDDDEYDLQYDLRKPEEIVIADDTYAHQAFGESLFAAPQEDVLEGLYPCSNTPVLKSFSSNQHFISVLDRSGLVPSSRKSTNEPRSLNIQQLLVTPAR